MWLSVTPIGSRMPNTTLWEVDVATSFMSTGLGPNHIHSQKARLLADAQLDLSVSIKRPPAATFSPFRMSAVGAGFLPTTQSAPRLDASQVGKKQIRLMRAK